MPIDQTQVDLWRQKCLAGTLTDDELREAVRVLREDRESAYQKGTARRAAKGPMKTGDELLDELDAM